ncbi:hypothetical protein C0J52_12956 [Blattella germanica]|nr:hypothetical protein C0J52_12956 [Blattella germanica]
MRRTTAFSIVHSLLRISILPGFKYELNDREDCAKELNFLEKHTPNELFPIPARRVVCGMRFHVDALNREQRVRFQFHLDNGINNWNRNVAIVFLSFEVWKK